jgi:hypothetical protein
MTAATLLLGSTGARHCYCSEYTFDRRRRRVAGNDGGNTTTLDRQLLLLNIPLTAAVVVAGNDGNTLLWIDRGFDIATARIYL